ncbi:Oligopeptide transport system permease protein OppB [Methanosarcina mazei WWM610]|uniref:Oligopeptide transport system permease protein OppB n=2 Tax=Methanosarcina mazei TaxID=2209 RepID=A0A0E3PXZ5_METMZ|nr:Oligopeptide transport system permease protein OppB [Methanosarcina mazei WWM610]AKB72615.1 Oligopeptide transport system permease protein OppB [Methanosarcina mazei C16]
MIPEFFRGLRIKYIHKKQEVWHVIEFIARRLLLLVPVLLLVSVISFSIIYISPGDTAENAIMNPGGGVDRKAVEEFRAKTGLDEPVHIQYINWMGRVLRGDLGESYMTGVGVSESIFRCFKVTLKLAVVSMLVSLVIALPLGIISAVKKGTVIDDVCRLFALAGVSMPNFWQAYLLIIVFALTLKVLPSSGYGDGGITYLFLPAVTLGTGYAAVTMRLMRSSMIEVLQQDYVRAARAKGVPEHMVIFRHALKNSLIPVVTVAGLNFGYLLNGSVIVETIFSWPGIGNLIVSSILSKDYPMIQGCVLFIAVIFVLVNFAVDISYAYLNPRIRYENKN